MLESLGKRFHILAKMCEIDFYHQPLAKICLKEQQQFV